MSLSSTHYGYEVTSDDLDAAREAFVAVAPIALGIRDVVVGFVERSIERGWTLEPGVTVDHLVDLSVRTYTASPASIDDTLYEVLRMVSSWTVRASVVAEIG